MDTRTARTVLLLAPLLLAPLLFASLSADDVCAQSAANVALRAEGDLLHCNFYDASERGRSFLAIMPTKWDAWGWPVVPAAVP